MASELDLYNLALSHLGEDALLDDPDADPPPRGLRVARALAAPLIDAALRKHAFQCATRRFVLPQLDIPPSIDWRFPAAFGLPIGLLRVISVSTGRRWERGSVDVTNGSGAVTARREVIFASGNRALEAVLVVRPSFEGIDAALFDYLGCALAARMAGPMQSDKGLAQIKAKEAFRLWDDAVSAEISEFGNEPALFESTWLLARGGGDLSAGPCDYDNTIVQDHGRV